MRLLPLLLLLCAPLLLDAQYLETGVKFGTTNYVGDLTGQSLSRHGYHGAFGLFARYNASRRFSATASLLRGKLSADDANNPVPSLRERNLRFETNLIDLEVRGEINLMQFNIRADQMSTPFLFAGLSAFHFQPQTDLNGRFYDLRALGTEGQHFTGGSGFNYSNWQVAIPMGVGFKFGLGYKTTLGVELGYRLTFTDYLDDAGGVYPDIFKLEAENPVAAALAYRADGSGLENPVGQPRADASNNDAYFFLGATLAVNLTDRYGLDLDPNFRYWQRRDAKKAERDAEREQAKLATLQKRAERMERIAKMGDGSKIAERRAQRARQREGKRAQRIAEREHHKTLVELAKKKQAAERAKREKPAKEKRTRHVNPKRAEWRAARATAKAAHRAERAKERAFREQQRAQRRALREQEQAAKRLKKEGRRQSKRHKTKEPKV